jgi:hypothetical protein
LQPILTSQSTLAFDVLIHAQKNQLIVYHTYHLANDQKMYWSPQGIHSPYLSPETVVTLTSTILTHEKAAQVFRSYLQEKHTETQRQRISQTSKIAQLKEIEQAVIEQSRTPAVASTIAPPPRETR